MALIELSNLANFITCT